MTITNLNGEVKFMVILVLMRQKIATGSLIQVLLDPLSIDTRHSVDLSKGRYVLQLIHRYDTFPPFLDEVPKERHALLSTYPNEPAKADG